MSGSEDAPVQCTPRYAIKLLHQNRICLVVARSQSVNHWPSVIVRMLFWLTLATAIAWLLWYMTTAPGVSYSGPLRQLTGDEAQLAENLYRHVTAIASREHNQFRFAELEASARYI